MKEELKLLRKDVEGVINFTFLERSSLPFFLLTL